MSDEREWQPFAPLLYAPGLPQESIARGLRLRPRRALIRPWVLPPDTKTTSGLWKPVHRYEHPQVWGWLLAVTQSDVDRGFIPGGFYHYKRLSTWWLGDDAFPDRDEHTFDVLPVCAIHLDNVYALVEGAPALPTTADGVVSLAS